MRYNSRTRKKIHANFPWFCLLKKGTLNKSTWSLHDPLKNWVDDPIILGHDQPFCSGSEGDSKHAPISRENSSFGQLQPTTARIPHRQSDSLRPADSCECLGGLKWSSPVPKGLLVKYRFFKSASKLCG